MSHSWYHGDFGIFSDDQNLVHKMDPIVKPSVDIDMTKRSASNIDNHSGGRHESRHEKTAGPLTGNVPKNPLAFTRLDHSCFYRDLEEPVMSMYSYITKFYFQEPKERESLTIFDAMISLSAYHLGENALSSMVFYKQGDRNEILKAHQFLCRVGSQHYALALSKLLKIMCSPSFDLETAIVASTILSKVSVYEYHDLSRSAVFASGMIATFREILTAKGQASANNKLCNAIHYILFAYTTYYYPAYDPAVLEEFMEVINDFNNIAKRSANPTVNVQYWKLKHYLKELWGCVQSGTYDSPVTMYDLLRKWILILPPSVKIIHKIPDSIEKCLISLYRAMTLILIAIMPKPLFFCLQDFEGDLSSLKAEYEISEFIVDDDIRDIETYCMRVTAFFLKRYNILSIIYGINLIKGNAEPETICTTVNEVMISKFKQTGIKFYNYIHMPKLVEFSVGPAAAKNVLKRLDNLYIYNKHHIDHFRKLVEKTSSTHMSDDVSDQVMLYEIANLTRGGRLGILLTGTDDVAGDKSDLYRLPYSDYSYDAFNKALSLDYMFLFQDGTFQDVAQCSFDRTTGLLDIDRNPLAIFDRGTIVALMSSLYQDSFTDLTRASHFFDRYVALRSLFFPTNTE